MKTHSIWAVAAAVLIEEDDALHYEDLTQRIIKTDLTRLKEEGGTTPEKTVLSKLTTQHGGRSVFEREDFFADRGCYCVIDPEETRKMPKVADAIKALHAKKVNS